MLIVFLGLVAMCIVKSKLPANYPENYYLDWTIVNLFSKDCLIYINPQIVLAPAPELCIFWLTQKRPWYFSKENAVDLSTLAVMALGILPTVILKKPNSRYDFFKLKTKIHMTTLKQELSGWPEKTSHPP